MHVDKTQIEEIRQPPSSVERRTVNKERADICPEVRKALAHVNDALNVMEAERRRSDDQGGASELGLQGWMGRQRLQDNSGPI